MRNFQFVLLPIICTFLISQAVFSQSIINAKDEISGIYSTVLKDPISKKKKLIKIYIHKTSKNSVIGVIDLYQTKKQQGNPKSSIFLSEFIIKSNSIIFSNVNDISYYDNKIRILSIEQKGNELFKINGYKEARGKFDFPQAEYDKFFNEQEYNNFLNRAYTRLFDASLKSYMNKGILYLGKIIEKGFYIYYTDFDNISSFIGKEEIEVYYQSRSIFSDKISKIENIEKSIIEAFNYRFRNLSPVLSYLPNLKKIKFIELRSKKHMFNVYISEKEKYLNEDNVRIELTELSKEEIRSFNKKRELKEKEKLFVEKEKEKRALLYEKRLSDNGFNPSETLLEIDKSPKGIRNNTNELLFGEEFNDKLNELNRELEGRLNSSDKINIIDTELYFKNVFYGRFSELAPEKTNKNLFGSIDYFPEFHNAFLYYANKKFGNNYFSNMVSKEFYIVTKEKTQNESGSINISETSTYYEIFLPSVFLPKFREYLNEDQFSWSGEEFNLEFEYLILSFLEKYDYNSLAFKQMMLNLLRYSYGSEPAKSKSDLSNF